MTNMVHTGVWEGPCRFNVVTVEEEKRRVKQYYDSWSGDLKSGKIDFGVTSIRGGDLSFRDQRRLYPIAEVEPCVNRGRSEYERSA
jgi:hypothetical protein